MNITFIASREMKQYIYIYFIRGFATHVICIPFNSLDEIKENLNILYVFNMHFSKITSLHGN